MGDVLSRAFRDSFQAMNTDFKGIGLFLLGAIVTAAIVWRWRGREELKKHLVANVLIVSGGAVSTWILVFLVIIGRLPYKMLKESDTKYNKTSLRKRVS